jgi:hypothetical protein
MERNTPGWAELTRTVNAGRGPRTTEWRVERGGYDVQGGTERKRRWPKAWSVVPEETAKTPVCGVAVL